MTSNQKIVTTELLRALHRIHRQLADLKDRLEQGPRILKAQEAARERSEKEVAEVHEAHHRLQSESKNKQAELAAGEQKVEKRRQQLQEAKDNREFQALREQIAADEMANSVLADEALEAMEKADAFVSEVQAAEQSFEKSKSQFDAIASKVADAEPSIREDIDRLQTELTENESLLPEDFRELYDRIMRGRGPDGLAPVEGEHCAGCATRIPVNYINGLMLQKPTLCKSCGRLLYLPEGFEAV